MFTPSRLPGSPKSGGPLPLLLGRGTTIKSTMSNELVVPETKDVMVEILAPLALGLEISVDIVRQA